MNSTLFETDDFTVSQCHKCDVPGYLILESRSGATTISELTGEAQVSLGVLLADVETAIIDVLSPVNVYCCKYGEEGTVLHFHLFPRSIELTRIFLAQYPDSYPELYLKQGGLIHGPLLFDWARNYYKIELGCYSTNTISVFNELKYILARS